MRSLAIPLRITKGGLSRIDDRKKAIDNALGLLLTTPCFSCAADPQYGFIFNNLRFENFNETDGVVFNSASRIRLMEGLQGLYEKKISGSSDNLNTFAALLKETIEEYETRLRNVGVTMTYKRRERRIHIAVTGQIADTGEDYRYSSIINVWK